MSTASRPFDQLPTPVKRLIYCAFGVTLFIGVSQFVHPQSSLAAAKYDVAARRAGVPTAAGTQVAVPTSITAPESKLRLLGMLTGSPFRVWIYAGAKGPLYTVMDAGGKLLAREVSGEELYNLVPEVAVDQLHMDPAEGTSGPLMMVDPDQAAR